MVAARRTNYHGVEIDHKRDVLLNDYAKTLLKDYYCRKDEPSPQIAFARAAVAYCAGDLELAQRIYDAASKGWFMYASPVLSNAAFPGEKIKSLPISCFLSYVPDTLEGLIAHTTELRWLSVKGGGVGGHWSDVRSVSDVAPGPIPFIHTVDADMTAYRQGRTRKGSYAAYLDCTHPDIMEFLSIRVPTGDANRKCLNIHHGINITDAFMEAVQHDRQWALSDPNDETIREMMPARKLWEAILDTRYRTGEPYLHFIDTANAALPEPQKKLGLKIRGSNLCQEIELATDETRTAVCCLSSLNLETYDEWSSTSLVADLVVFLDNVLQSFIDNAGLELAKARWSAFRERSIGVGAMGFHSYLQRHNIAISSVEAADTNERIFAKIRWEALAASVSLAKVRGEAPDMAGTGLRNAHLLAIAPNANSSIIHDTSPSIEPWKANAFTARTRAGSNLVKNRYLEKVLENLGRNTLDVWSSIISKRGSVQHLDFLDAHTKEVFKTAIEIDQMVLVRLASTRQRYICQGQSLNLFFPPSATRTELHRIHFEAWRLKCKGLYYLRTEAGAKTEAVGEKVERIALTEHLSQDACPSCQG